jgi:hypothetical protein
MSVDAIYQARPQEDISFLEDAQKDLGGFAAEKEMKIVGTFHCMLGITASAAYHR